MTWRASDTMSERVKFIGLLRSGERTLSGLCREFGISRPTGYKWAERFEEEGAEGLKERSRAPSHRPQETSAEVQEVLVQARQRHPSWGPRKLKAWLEESGLSPTACVDAGETHFTIVGQSVAFAVEWATATADGEAAPACFEGPALPSCP